MPYYPTLAEDVQRAKEILAKGKPDLPETMRESTREAFEATAGGTIYGADTYAAYKLLESFVEAIEAVEPKVCELAIRHRKKLDAVRADVRQALAEHIPGCTCIIVNGEYRSTEMGGCPVHPKTGAAPPSITCPRCGMTSYNRNDIKQRYCGACHKFHDEMECVCRTTSCGHVASQHHNGVCEVCDKGICWC